MYMQYSVLKRNHGEDVCASKGGNNDSKASSRLLLISMGYPTACRQDLRIFTGSTLSCLKSPELINCFEGPQIQLQMKLGLRL